MIRLPGAVDGVHLGTGRFTRCHAIIQNDDLMADIFKAGILRPTSGRIEQIVRRIHMFQPPDMSGLLPGDLGDQRCARVIKREGRLPDLIQQSIGGDTGKPPSSGAGSQSPTITMS